MVALSDNPEPGAAGLFAPLEREPAYQQIYRTIEQHIASGQLPAGSLLPTEAELCRRFGVTRSTVREGLRLLQQAGLVERGPRKRFVVKRPSSAEVAQTASRSLALSGATFREAWEALALCYPQAARLAAERLDPARIDRLAEVSVPLEAAEATPEAVVAAAVEFFRILAEGLDNRVLGALLAVLNLLIGESLRPVIRSAPRARERILAAQRNLVAAFRARDPELAETWMARHIADLKRGYQVAGVALERTIL